MGQVLADECGVGVVAVEASLDGGQLMGEAVLQVQGDGAVVVGVEELAALVLRATSTETWNTRPTCGDPAPNRPGPLTPAEAAHALHVLQWRLTQSRDRRTVFRRR